MLTCVIPCYNEEDSLILFKDEMIKVSNILKKEYQETTEIIFINDGSNDDTLNIIKSFAKENDMFKYISFSRNFGKEAAMYAGLQHAKGNYVVFLDADMQDPPSLIPEMYQIVSTTEYDSVATRRENRDGEPKIRSFFARLFYKIINKISDIEIVDGARDFRMMNRTMVDAILSMKEYNRFSKGIFSWVGFKTKWISYSNVERVAGTTKWSFLKLFSYSIEGILAFSTIPLALASLIGCIVCLMSILYAITIFIQTLIYNNPVDGWPSIVCLISFLGGLQLFSTGILGQYLAKTYLETKKRPIYIIKESEGIL